MKLDWTANLITAASAVFIVLCLVSIDNSRISIMRSRQHMELSNLGLTSISPDNLPNAVENLGYSIPREDHFISRDDLVNLPAWTKFRETVSAYAERLKLLDQQAEELDEHLQQRTLWASYAALAAILVNLCLVLWNRRRAVNTAVA